MPRYAKGSEAQKNYRDLQRLQRAESHGPFLSSKDPAFASAKAPPHWFVELQAKRDKLESAIEVIRLLKEDVLETEEAFAAMQRLFR